MIITIFIIHTVKMVSSHTSMQYETLHASSMENEATIKDPGQRTLVS